MQFVDLLGVEALTFDDVLLVPGYAEVLPSQLDLRTRQWIDFTQNFRTSSRWNGNFYFLCFPGDQFQLINLVVGQSYGYFGFLRFQLFDIPVRIQQA